MAWRVEITDIFETWWSGLSLAEQEAIDSHVGLLKALGPALSRPHVDTIKGSQFPNMKELRVQKAGRPLRILFAFDPHRTALLLLGGDKTGDKRWYAKAVPQADRLFALHLTELEKTGKRKG